jgi:hypothetical protein
VCSGAPKQLRQNVVKKNFKKKKKVSAEEGPQMTGQIYGIQFFPGAPKEIDWTYLT